MPFSLINAFAIFQHMMNDVFREYLNDFVVCFINDILSFSKNVADHERHVHIVLENQWCTHGSFYGGFFDLGPQWGII
jgi:hypothetical protein